MTTIYDISIPCPCCGNTFRSPTWGSTNTCGPISSDLHFESLGYSYLPLEVHTCDHCGYSLDSDELYAEDTSSSPVTPELRERIRQRIFPLIETEIPPGAQRYEFAALISKWRGDDFYRIGERYLKAAWCSDERREYDDGLQYRRQALTWFEKELREMRPSKDYDRAVLLYQAGDLNRRTGNREKAAFWFDQVEEAVVREGKHFWLIDLAARQRDHPQEFIKDRESVFNDDEIRYFDKLHRRCFGFVRICRKRMTRAIVSRFESDL
jgi:uncharacterized protein (DUF2225 family)